MSIIKSALAGLALVSSLSFLMVGCGGGDGDSDRRMDPSARTPAVFQTDSGDVLGALARQLGTTPENLRRIQNAARRNALARSQLLQWQRYQYMLRLYQAQMQQAAARRGMGGQRPWSRTTQGGHIGGDGQTFYFIDGNSSYISGP